MPISAVHAITCNNYLITLIGSSYALTNVGFFDRYNIYHIFAIYFSLSPIIIQDRYGNPLIEFSLF